MSAWTIARGIIPPETAHILAINWLRCPSLVAKQELNSDPVKLMGLNFKNRIGMAAGFDKNGEAILGLAKLGFGHIEIGTVTPKPQPGNPRPRVFRLPDDDAIINRYGFNSAGAEIVYKNILISRQYYNNTPNNNNHNKLKKSKAYNISPSKQQLNNQVILGINIGKNKHTENAVDDYIIGLKRFHDVADYITINISSPNTPNLRDLQKSEPLRRLLQTCRDTLNGLSPTPPLLLKIAPDINIEHLHDILQQVIDAKIDGIIISNTTTERAEYLKNPMKNQTGGLSGRPLFEKSTNLLRHARSILNAQNINLPIIGVGGISNKKNIEEKLTAGADLIQVYTAIALNGFGIMQQW